MTPGSPTGEAGACRYRPPSGDEHEHFEHHYPEISRAVRHAFRGIPVHDAEDLEQEVVIGLVRRWPLAHCGNVAAFAQRAAIWKARRYWKQRGRQAIGLPESFVSAASDSDRGLEDRISSEVAHLPVELRKVVVLRVVEGMTYEQIAQVLETTPSTAYRRWRLARETLGQRLADLRPGPRRRESVVTSTARDTV